MINYLGRQFGAGLFVLLMISSQGCTQRAWFQGFVEGQKNQCNKLDEPERTTCLDSINDDYDRYQRDREEYLQRQK